MKYRYGDQEVQGETPQEVIQAMQALSAYDAHKSLREYVRDLAKRVHADTGKAVRSDSHEHFVADLVSQGLLKEQAL